MELGRAENGERYVAKTYPKGRRARFVDASDEVLEVLAGLVERRGLRPDSSEPLLVMPSGALLDQSTLVQVFKRACATAGIPARSPKHLRSTRASWLLKETGDLMYVKGQLGHATVTTTERYLAVVDETEVDNVSAFEAFRRPRAVPGEAQFAI